VSSRQELGSLTATPLPPSNGSIRSFSCLACAENELFGPPLSLRTLRSVPPTSFPANLPSSHFSFKAAFVICHAITCSVAVWNLSLAQTVGQNSMPVVIATRSPIDDVPNSGCRCLHHISGCYRLVIHIFNVSIVVT
jgi:hypothetical protein